MLENKVALVTGAGRGIGRAIAIALAKEGAEVVVNYNGSEERAKEVKQTIEENGGKASIYKCNVSDFEACEAMIKDIVKEHGRLDILINNAGITKDGLIMKMKEEDFDSVLNVNLKGTFNTIRHSARQMLRQKSGKIINISSVSGILGNAGQARCDRSDKDNGKRTRKPRYHSKCNRTGICGYRDDRCSFRRNQGKCLQTDYPGTIWKTGRYRECGGISGIRQSRLYHRTGHQCGWGNECISFPRDIKSGNTMNCKVRIRY